MLHMAMKVERQLKRKGKARNPSNSNSSWKPKWDGRVEGIFLMLKSNYQVEKKKLLARLYPRQSPNLLGVGISVHEKYISI